MIELVTGTPGSGKTLYTVDRLRKEAKAGRRILVDGIRDLAIDHVLVDEQWMRKWHENCQPNDLIVVDEVQRIWPPVSVSVKPGEDVEKLHVHRHLGVDFIVITQHPQRMNKTIRDLVGRHVHVRRLFGRRSAMLYEWDHAHNPNSGFRDAVKTLWRYPKDVFSLYTSAELHTKPKAVIPKALFILPVGLLVVAIGAWKGFKAVSGGFGIGGQTGSAVSSSAVAVPPLGGVASVVGSAASGVKVGSSTWRVAGQYAVDGRGYVLLASPDGRFRREPADDFRGETLGVTGTVDGERVAVWTGAVAAGSGGVTGARK